MIDWLVFNANLAVFQLYRGENNVFEKVTPLNILYNDISYKIDFLLDSAWQFKWFFVCMVPSIINETEPYQAQNEAV